jgi:hypothetical protein
MGSTSGLAPVEQAVLRKVRVSRAGVRQGRLKPWVRESERAKRCLLMQRRECGAAAREPGSRSDDASPMLHRRAARAILHRDVLAP